MHLIHRNTCRICGSSHLIPVLSLGDMFLQGSFVRPGIYPPMRKIPTQLVHCDPMANEHGCGLLQLEYSVPPEILYSTYWYRSGISNTMRSHLMEIANQIVEQVGDRQVRVLDIGCNDGTLLGYLSKDWDLVGIDPSPMVREIPEPIQAIQDFFPSNRLYDEEQFDVITSIAMFYDLEDPKTFVRGIRSMLKEDGIWIFEVSYMPLMLTKLSYDTICHEHLEYYSLAVLENLLSMCGMKVLSAHLNDTNGGSIRCTASRKEDYPNGGNCAMLSTIRQQEFDMELDTGRPYNNFAERVVKHSSQLRGMILNLVSMGKSIHGYGASTKGNTLLQMAGLDRGTIPYIADRDPHKHGGWTLGTNIPIISEEESRPMKPDYYLVLPWHFREEIVKREKDVKLIFPLPDIEIVEV